MVLGQKGAGAILRGRITKWDRIELGVWFRDTVPAAADPGDGATACIPATHKE